MAPAVVNAGQGLTGTPTVNVVDTDKFPVDGPLLQGARVFARLSKRTEDPSKGVVDPHSINNAGFFFLFALIGVAFVITGIWFFFYAKNGGIHFKDNDWDDYKSTVLRRRGPNGTLLSGATESTDLGGGSVYKRYDDHDEDDGRTHITDSTYLTGITAGASDIFAREKRKKKKEARDAERRKRRGDKGKSTDGAGSSAFEGVVDEQAERDAKKHLRSYRHEKAARVGGINKEAEGSEWEGSTNAAESSVGATSELLANQEPPPLSSPVKDKAPSSSSPPKTTPKSGGIRKVYSTADRRENKEAERERAEARRLRAANRVAQRDFGYQRAAGAVTNSQLSESLLSGSGSGGSTTLGESSIPEEESEVGTKSYHHPMPELKEQRRREREERRARRSKSGYRRGNTDENTDA